MTTEATSPVTPTEDTVEIPMLYSRKQMFAILAVVIGTFATMLGGALYCLLP